MRRDDGEALGRLAPVALFEADADMVIQAVNPRMAALVGAPAPALVGRSFRELLTRSSQFVYALKAEPSLLTSGSAEEVFLELAHADGAPRPVLLTVTPSEDARRRYGALFSAPERRAYELELIAARQGVLDGLQEQKAARAALEAANLRLEELVQERTATLAQRDLLLREVYHRVKNNLQVVDGLMLMQSRKLSDHDAVAAIEGLRKRVYALGLVHHQLMGSADLKTFDVGAFLSQLIAHLQVGAPENVDLRIDAAPLSVDLDFAVPLGLLVTELTTNALKHAFPGREGEISVTLGAAAEGEVVLRVADNGVGFSEVAAEAKPSMGLKIVRGLVRQLGGTIRSLQTDGVCWEAHLPAPRSA